MKKLLFFALALLLVCCGKYDETAQTSAQAKNWLSFADDICWEGEGQLLKNCDEFYNEEGYFFFLIAPKSADWTKSQLSKFKGSEDEKDEALLESVGENLSASVGDFRIGVFHIPVKFLEKTPNGDTPYREKFPYTSTFYEFENGDWIAKDSVVVKSSADSEREMGFIDRHKSELRGNAYGANN